MTVSLDAALSGMLEQQRSMDFIANNLANVNTAAYKRAKVHFQDLLTNTSVLSALRGEIPGQQATISSGVNSSPVERSFDQGPLYATGRDLDFAISGDGFFKVRLEDGSTAYTRDGVFQMDAQGHLTLNDGSQFDPPIQLPPTFSDLTVTREGTLTIKRPLTADELAALGPDDARDGKTIEVGKIELVRFPFPSGLASIGNGRYIETPESQAPIADAPGLAGMGVVVNGFQEGSNVQIADEMAALVMASRAYQLNLNAYRTVEEMLRQANQVVQ